MNENSGEAQFIENQSRIQEKENELAGGIKNALERGESLEKVKQSFLNAGYSRQEVEEASRLIGKYPNSESAIYKNKPVDLVPTASKNKSLTQIQDNQSQIKTQGISYLAEEPKSSYKKWIILAIVSVLILTGATLTGIYWDSIVKLFS